MSIGVTTGFSQPQRASTGQVGRILVSDIAVEIRPANSNRMVIVVKNMSESIVLYLGWNDTVTHLNGFPLIPGQIKVIDTNTGPIWGITESETIEVAWEEY